MKKQLSFISAIVLGFSLLAPVSAMAAGGADARPGVVVTNEEAAKKYPPGPAGYVEGIAVATTTGGFFQSPYSSRVYDCRKIKKGALVLDEPAKKVFLRP